MHLLIGIGEGLITAVTVGAVLAVRPDLVYGARGLAKPLELRGTGGTTTVVPEERPVTTGGGLRPFLLGGVGLTLVLAGVVSFFASGDPDGLEAVGESEGFLAQQADHLFGRWALADYGEVGGIPVGVAGILGVGLVLLIAGAVAWAARNRDKTADKTRV
ncbi:PDGLE domain-containing protein [Nonomuraea thailandensis]